MFDSGRSDDSTGSVDQHGARAAGAHIYPDQVHCFRFVGTFLTQNRSAAKVFLRFDELTAFNPRLIYCAVSGYGRTGPYADKGGFDLIAQGLVQVDSAPVGKSDRVHAGSMLDVKIPGSTITEAGLRTNVSVGIQYIASWLRGKPAQSPVAARPSAPAPSGRSSTGSCAR